MDPNNISGITSQDDLDESNFSTVSSPGMDLKQMAEKIKKLETKLSKNEQKNQFGEPSMMQMVWQFGEKFGELKKEMAGMAKEIDGLKAINHVEIIAFQELEKKVKKMGHDNEKLIDENGQLKTEIVKIKQEFSGKNAEMEQKIVEKDSQIQEIREEIMKLGQEVEKLWKENEKLLKVEGKWQKVEEMEKGIAEVKAEIDKLAKNNDGMKQQCEIFISRVLREIQEKQIANDKILANLGEQIAELAFKLNFIEIKENKWNAAYCGPKMVISEEGRVVKHSGPYAWNFVHPQLHIPKFNLNSKLIAYFEVEILVKPPNSSRVTQDRLQQIRNHIFRVGIRIGFCTDRFHLEGKFLGDVENSIGIAYKSGISINGNFIEFTNCGGFFHAEDVIGIGIVHFQTNSIKCFACCNGDLLGWAELPPKFANLQLFPAATLYATGDSLRANFSQKEWRHNPRQLLNNSENNAEQKY